MQLSTFITLSGIILVPLVQAAIIKGSYIVKLKGDNSLSLTKHIIAVEKLFGKYQNPNKIKSQYKELGPIYHATFTQEVLNKVKSMPDVDYVDVDRKVKVSTVQKKAPWGLVRISQRPKLSKLQNYNYNYDGSGVSVYIIDSGIDPTHPEFQGRARIGARFAGRDDEDDLGHGTHVAGIVGSINFGVAKKAELVGVKVVDDNGISSVSNIISGISWSVGDKKGKKGNVINISLQSEKSVALNQAVSAAIGKSFVVVVAAGNNNLDACNYSPASEQRAITVAATDKNDVRATFSNWGRCVTVFAPGVDVLSTWKYDVTKFKSGTSQATPHVAGLAACFLSQKTESAAAIKKKIIDLASKDIVKNPGSNSFNRFVYSGFN